jgi:cellobiose-specific phosphotransferase system component IIB
MDGILFLCCTGFTSGIMAKRVREIAYERGLQLNVYWSTALKWNTTTYLAGQTETSDAKAWEKASLGISMNKSRQTDSTPDDRQYDNVSLVLVTPQAKMYLNDIRLKIPRHIPICLIEPKSIGNYEALLAFALQNLPDKQSQ